jgi:hypothetical protein
MAAMLNHGTVTVYTHKGTFPLRVKKREKKSRPYMYSCLAAHDEQAHHMTRIHIGRC